MPLREKNIVQAEYLRRMQSLSVKDRVARAASMHQMCREIIARGIQEEVGMLPPEELKWRVAMRQYGSDPHTRALITRMLANVSH